MKMESQKKLSEIIIDLELSSLCNLSCTFCPRSKIKRSKHFIDLNTIDSLIPIIDEKHIIWFSGMGEPFLHPNLPEIIRRIKKSGAKVYTNTNASAPRYKDTLDIAIKEGLDYVNISIYGHDNESYKTNTRKNVFDRVLDNVKFLQNLKVPYRISYVASSEVNKNELRKKLEDVFGTDKIRLPQLHHRSFSSREQSISECALAQFYLFISSDGNVFSCVNDVSGENNFGKDIYTAAGEKRKEYPFKICVYCDEPHRTIPYKEDYFQRVFDLSSRQK